MTRTPVLHIGSIHCLLYISSINWEEDIKVAWPQTQLGLLLRHKLNIVQDSVERRFLLRTTKESQLLYNLVNWLTQTSCLLFDFHSCTRWQANIWRILYPLDCTKNLVMEFFYHQLRAYHVCIWYKGPLFYAVPWQFAFSRDHTEQKTQYNQMQRIKLA